MTITGLMVIIRILCPADLQWQQIDTVVAVYREATETVTKDRRGEIRRWPHGTYTVDVLEVRDEE